MQRETRTEFNHLRSLAILNRLGQFYSFEMGKFVPAVSTAEILGDVQKTDYVQLPIPFDS